MHSETQHGQRPSADGLREVMAEDSFGRAKRYAFVSAVIQEVEPRTVLDFGCGSGTQLTQPLAQTHPHVRFLGVDSDEPTIEWAKRQSLPSNLTYAGSDAITAEQKFDMIIASEVLEHVESPEELLGYLRSRLDDDGHLIVTVPNGYGPFEAAALVENMLTVAGVLSLLRGIKRRMWAMPQPAGSQIMTLAVSPHVNFFSRKSVESILHNSGFEILVFRARTVFCGFLLDRLVRGRLLEWNGRLADRLPYWCASDWMLVCRKGAGVARHGAPWQRNWWGRFRRRLSERRWAGVTMPYA